MGIETRYEYKYYTVLDVEKIVKLLCDAGTEDEMMKMIMMMANDDCYDNGYEDELLSQRYNGDETRYNYEVHGIAPPDIDEGCVDGLAGLGGRL